MINWKVRIKQKWFWISMVAGVLLLIQAVLLPFNVKIDFAFLNDYLVGIINAIFSILVLIGVCVDPTTEGLGDSELAKTYEFPKTKEGIYKAGEDNGEADV